MTHYAETPIASPASWLDIILLSPELILAGGFLVFILLDLFVLRRQNSTVMGWLTIGALLLSTVVLLLHGFIMNAGQPQADAVAILSQSYSLDDFASLSKLLFLASAALITLLAIGTHRKSQHKNEYYYFILPATLGAMVMVSAIDAVTLYVGLELLSITSYILVAMKRDDGKSFESSFKYIVTGSISSAFILFGISYLYGITGSTSLSDMKNAIQIGAANEMHYLLYVGLLFIAVGFLTKIAAAPFHLWAPDVYQGASTPITAFLGVLSKAAAAIVLFRLTFNIASYTSTAQLDIAGSYFLLIQLVAIIAMLVGTTTALRQRNLKRLLALSGVANAGYLLVPLSAQLDTFTSSQFGVFYFYLVAYVCMTVGSFAIVSAISNQDGSEQIDDLAGLYARSPWLAISFTILLISLAGLPISAGFFGKLFILLQATQNDLYGLVAVMIISSILSYYFYFKLVRQMFLRPATDPQPVQVSVPLKVVIFITIAVTVALGIWPSPLLDWVNVHFGLVADLLF